MSIDSRSELAAAREAYARQLDWALESIVARLTQIASVRRISVFGSYARGRRDLFTDLDLLVVMETDKPFIDRLTELYGGLSVPVDLDLVCYTPDEFEAMSKRGFLKSALEGEKVLFERAA